MNSVASNYLALKYQKSTTSSSIDIGIRKFEFVTKTQFLCYFLSYIILLLSFLLFLFHSLYFCHFFYRPLQFGIMIFFSLEKELPVGFPQIIQNPGMKVVEKGRNAVLVCEATGEPAPVISWVRDTVPINLEVCNQILLSSENLNSYILKLYFFLGKPSAEYNAAR